MGERRARGSGSVYLDQRGYWTVVIPLPSIDGKRRRKVYRSRSREKVMVQLRAFEDARRGTDLPQTNVYPNGSGTTVETWFEYWLTECVYPQLRPKTAEGYRSIVKNRIVPALGASTPISSVRASDIRRMHHLIRESCSSTTALNAHAVAARAFEVAVREDEIERNPVRLVDPPRRNYTPLDVPSTTEVRELLRMLQSHPDGLRWTTFILTGARRGEVLGLETDRVSESHIDISWQLQRLKRGPSGRPIAPPDFQYRHLYGGYYFTRPKTKAGWRVVPLIQPLSSMMRAHLAEMEPNKWGLVFTRKARPIDPDSQTKAWREISRAHFGPGRHVRLHDLRHATVDLLYAADVPEDVIIELVGHTTRAMTRSYKSPAKLDRLSTAMSRVEGLLDDSAEQPRTFEDGR
ncbi:tyrosine-type recombinase/integrase [Microbacterium sp. 8M]|uniref:tyrosine-type recombinase/integrase n=1 Tax=Microbacterium sp. 8M TaxID=2653153 RepID=UPI001356BF7D|nr:tyrosine-type recombinase/integrase [Microbacterium sp. 8M]